MLHVSIERRRKCFPRIISVLILMISVRKCGFPFETRKNLIYHSSYPPAISIERPLSSMYELSAMIVAFRHTGGVTAIDVDNVLSQCDLSHQPDTGSFYLERAWSGFGD